MKNENKKGGRVSTIVLSVILAVVVWVVVGVVSDSDVKNTMSSLPVKYKGMNSLAEQGLLIVTPEEKNGSSVTLSGKRGDLIRFGKGVYISIDVSGITSAGEYTLSGNIQLPNNRISIVRESLEDFEIMVEPISEKEVPVEVKQTGVLRNNLIKAQPEHSMLKVRGAKSEVQEVSAAVVTADISKIAADGLKYMEFKLVDEAGNVLTKSMTLSPVTDRIPVEFTVYQKKTLPVVPRLSAEFENNYYLDEQKSTVTPSTVEVGVLDSCEAECVYANIDSVSGDVNEFSLIVVEGMYIPEEELKVKVKTQISPIVSRYMDVSVKTENLGEDMSASFDDTVMNVLLSSTEDILNSGDFRLILNLEGLEKGKHHVKAEISDDRIDVAEDIYVDVIIE